MTTKWQQMISKWTPNDHQMSTKWHQMITNWPPNDHQMTPKLRPNDTQMIPNDNQMNPKWSPNTPKWYPNRNQMNTQYQMTSKWHPNDPPNDIQMPPKWPWAKSSKSLDIRIESSHYMRFDRAVARVCLRVCKIKNFCPSKKYFFDPRKFFEILKNELPLVN